MDDLKTNEWAVLAQFWENLPSPYEQDVRDREAALHCIRAVLSALGHPDPLA